MHGVAIGMALAGQSYRFIAQRTGLSIGEVRSTCYGAGIRVSDYRNGLNIYGQNVAKLMNRIGDTILDTVKDSVHQLEENIARRLAERNTVPLIEAGERNGNGNRTLKAA